MPGLVALLSDDVLGAGREAVPDDRPQAAGAASEAPAALEAPAAPEAPVAASDRGNLDSYLQAFALIAQDPNQLLIAVEEDADLVGTLQLSLVPSLSRRGALRLQIEAVRIGRTVQGAGLGTAVFEWAHGCGRRFGARLAQLTTDKSRHDAQRFYARLGYVASHEGLKLDLG